MKRLLSIILLLFASAVGAESVPRQQSAALDLSSSPEQSWWVTDSALDPDGAQTATDCRRAFPDAHWKREVEPRQNPGKTVATDRNNPLVWYCRSFDFAHEPEGAYALKMGPVDDVDRTYLNGHLIGSTGDFRSPLAQAYDRVRLYAFQGDKLNRGPNLILVQVKGYSVDVKWGLYVDRVVLGPASDIIADFYASNFFDLGFLIAYFTVASYFLFLFLRRQKERENMAFAAFTYLLVLYQFLRTQLKYDILDDFLLWKRIEYVALFLLVPSFFYFIRTYFDLPKNRWVKLLDRLLVIPALVALTSIGIVIYSDDAALWSHVNVQYNQLTLVWPPFVLSLLGILVYRMRIGDRDAYFMIGGVLLLMAAAVVDSFTNVGILNLPRLAGYAFAFYVLGLGLILANRFVRVNERVEELNTSLEKKVEQRTSELQDSLEQIQYLKVQQDGDYFLTSLLIHPLASTDVNSSKVHVESYTRQKKQFQFKTRKSEIGGDISIAYSIELRGRRYIAFLNADAMGKSIQGAGGAIVIGTVFKSLVTRTHIDPTAQVRSPERWLKDCFKELQDVFCSFDGSMLISAVIGLLEEDSGFLLILNAEHPWSVLFRDGKASFLEEELMLRKLGVDGFDSGFRLRKYQLQPGDVLLLGSDGRDDVLLPGKNGPEFNEDHFLFLEHVNRARGELQTIVDSISSAGEITDDLSLLRIGYLEDPPINGISTVEERKTEAFQLMDRAEAIAATEFREATRIALDATAKYPVDDELFFRAAQLLASEPSSMDASLAARDLSERLRIRSPDNVENLLLLARLASAQGDNTMARKVLNEAVSLDSGNRAAPDLLTSLPDKG